MTEAYRDFQDRLSYNYLISHDVTNFDLLEKKLKMIPGNTNKYNIEYT